MLNCLTYMEGVARTGIPEKFDIYLVALGDADYRIGI